MVKVVTIGVYETDEAGFFDALREAGVDTFCDIRWRRAVRGSEYAFVNSKRLQKRLAAVGIRYFHVRAVAPGPQLRKAQDDIDKAEGVARRQRTQLGKAFIEGYRRNCLAGFNSRNFIKQLGPRARVVALFCVEREPAACHRSLLADRLKKDLDVRIDHIIPRCAS